MVKKHYQTLNVEVFYHEDQDVITASVIEQGVQWDSSKWTKEDLKGDFYD